MPKAKAKAKGQTPKIIAHNQQQMDAAEGHKVKAYRLHKAGMSCRMIAAQMSDPTNKSHPGGNFTISHETVAKYIREARAEVQEQIQAEIGDLTKKRKIEIELIHDIKQRHLLLLYGDPKTAKGAADVLLKASEQECKLLGLYAPTRIEATGANGGPIQIDYTKLTDIELAQLQVLVVKATVEASSV